MYSKETLYEQLPAKMADNFKKIELELISLQQIVRVYDTLRKYADMGLIKYYSNSDGTQYYDSENFNKELEKYKEQFEVLKPFIPCYGDKEIINRTLIIDNPSKVLIALENTLLYDCLESRINDIIKILTGKVRIQKRTREEKLNILKFYLLNETNKDVISKLQKKIDQLSK